MDFGVQVDAHCSDMQRTLYVLEPGETEPPADLRKEFATIRSAVAETIGNISTVRSDSDSDGLTVLEFEMTSPHSPLPDLSQLDTEEYPLLAERTEVTCRGTFRGPSAFDLGGWPNHGRR
jgi:hypothetical protein